MFDPVKLPFIRFTHFEDGEGKKSLWASVSYVSSTPVAIVDSLMQ